MDNSIPKIIHYCWFGRGDKSKFIKKCIASWKRELPDYQIIEWNEDNFPIDYNNYVREAYINKKYAFVSDVARLYALKEIGGFYFDTDIEAKKPLDNYLDISDVIMAFESKSIVMTGCFAARKNSNFINQWLHSYDSLRYRLEDGTFDVTPNTFRISNMLTEMGMVHTGEKQKLSNGVTIYPKEIFGAFDVDNSAYAITPETVIVHHCKSSWMPLEYKVTDFIKRRFARVIGVNNYKKLRLKLKGKS